MISCIDNVLHSMFPGWDTVHNSIPNMMGRICICWNPQSINFSCLINEQQHIMGRIQSSCSSGKMFLLSVVYGSNDRAWLVEGDFNIVRASSESVGGGEPNIGAMCEFNDYIRDIEVSEHPHSGSQFTWCRNWKEKGLFRVLV
ncbi:hypothetical protein LIER_43260 [Lithospermum erythrorhizon]|uniref:Uncharacterized protein n=1 Tax=Lithospermum erythrorhizon TaxID=34254 RepID=A0AAV3PW09_LITER